MPTTWMTSDLRTSVLSEFLHQTCFKPFVYFRLFLRFLFDHCLLSVSFSRAVETLTWYKHKC